MRRFILLLFSASCVLLTGCSYNGQEYFGRDSGVWYDPDNAYLNDTTPDEEFVYKDLYQTDQDYLFVNFDSKSVSDKPVEEIVTYDFIDTTISLVNQGEVDAYANTVNSKSSTSSSKSSSRDTSEKGKEVVDYARKFLGNPYKYGGESLTKGADCSGFVQSIYKHFGYSLDRTAHAQYLQCKSGKRGCRLVKESELLAGDLIFYLCPGTSTMRHVAIYSGNNTRVHASSSETGIIESPGLGGRPHNRTHTDTLYFGRVLK